MIINIYLKVDSNVINSAIMQL